MCIVYWDFDLIPSGSLQKALKIHCLFKLCTVCFSVLFPIFLNTVEVLLRYFWKKCILVAFRILPYNSVMKTAQLYERCWWVRIILSTEVGFGDMFVVVLPKSCMVFFLSESKLLNFED